MLGIGTRFQDFTTGSWSLFANPNLRLASLNVAAYDAAKHGAYALVSDAKTGLEALGDRLGDYQCKLDIAGRKDKWFAKIDPLTAAPQDSNQLPSDMQVIGAVQRSVGENTMVMCAAGTMPGELHKLWKAGSPGSYHMEYGFSYGL